MQPLHVVMPVKDSPTTTHRALQALMACEGVNLTVYNDFSTDENTALLAQWASELGYTLHNWADHTNTPSPNYRLTLIDARSHALEAGSHLVIVESDVEVQPDTLARMAAAVHADTGLVAAVTTDADGTINFPYQYARHLHGTTIATTKRLSFCCTLLTNKLLQEYDFNTLDPTRQWFDVTISHQATHLGFRNLLMLDNPVLHTPHASRPWKKLKYTHPLRYYWQKITRHRDRI